MFRPPAALLLLATTGCLVDGRHFIRGTITSAGPEHQRLARATASVERCVPREDVIADAQGAYEATCGHGGMCFLFWCPGAGVPEHTLRYTAPGHEPLSVELLEETQDARVSRQRCVAPDGRSPCYQLDVMLDPAARRP